MTFAQRRNRLATHFSERIPVAKRRISVFIVKWSLAWVVRGQMVGQVEKNDFEKVWKRVDVVCFEIMDWH
jgi:hypothetical protein